MNQDTTTPQPHPWVTTSTPDNLRNPQLLQDLSEIGMTCLLGWHALMDTPHSYAAESVWYGKAKTWAEELERLYLTYTQGDDWMTQFPAPSNTSSARRMRTCPRLWDALLEQSHAGWQRPENSHNATALVRP